LQAEPTHFSIDDRSDRRRGLPLLPARSLALLIIPITAPLGDDLDVSLRGSGADNLAAIIRTVAVR
jgi:hypothetical protein